MTINKCSGESNSQVCFYLQRYVFTHVLTLKLRKGLNFFILNDKEIFILTLQML